MKALFYGLALGKNFVARCLLAALGINYPCLIACRGVNDVSYGMNCVMRLPLV
jgi:hypothetical protein